ncbi:MAG: LptE family protein [Nitrospinota bacterium]
MTGKRMGRRALLAGVLLLLSGCGYTLEGTRRPASLGAARSIHIPIFVNETREPDLGRSLASAVRERFLLDGRLRLVDPAEADLVLEAVIREYRQDPIGFSGADQVRRYRVLVRTHVRLRDTQRGRFILNQEIDSEAEYGVAAAIGGSEQARQQSTSSTATRFAEDILSLVLEGF